MIFVGPLNMLHQCSLVFARNLNHNNWKTIFKFSLTAGAVVSLIFTVFAFTEVGDFVLIELISVSPVIASIVKKVTAALALTFGEAAELLTTSLFIVKNNVLEKIYAENNN